MAPLVEEGLDVSLGKNAAAAGDGVEPLVAQGQLVHLVHRHVQQGGHLVDKGAGAAGAGAVHPLVHAAVKEDDLGVFAPQLNNSAGVGLQAADHLAGGEDLLDEGHVDGFRQPEPGTAGQSDGKVAVPDQRGRLMKQFQSFLSHLGQVGLVLLVQDLVAFQQHHLYCGAAHVDPKRQGA